MAETENRLPILLIAGSSVLLNAGLAATFFSWSKSLSRNDEAELDYNDVSEWMMGLRLLAYVATRYCVLNLLMSTSGFVGTIMRNTQMLRVFALGSLLDCTTVIFAILAFIIFSLTPSLSGPFADLICSEITRGESFGVTSYLREKETTWGIRGLSIVLWGRETCEENWTLGMLLLFSGIAFVGLIRVYMTYITWDFYWKVERTGRKYWVDLEAEQGEKRRMMTLDSTSKRGRTSRSNTLPSQYPNHPHHARFKSHSLPLDANSITDAHGRPKLVLVPVFYEPSSAPPPQFHSAPLRYSPTSSSPTSPTRSPRKHSRRQSAPLSSPTPSTSSSSSSSSCHSSYRSPTLVQHRCFSPSTASERYNSSRSYFESPVHSDMEASSSTGMKRTRSRSENSALAYAHMEQDRGSLMRSSDEKRA